MCKDTLSSFYSDHWDHDGPHSPACPPHHCGWHLSASRRKHGTSLHPGHLLCTVCHSAPTPFPADIRLRYNFHCPRNPSHSQRTILSATASRSLRNIVLPPAANLPPTNWSAAILCYTLLSTTVSTHPNSSRTSADSSPRISSHPILTLSLLKSTPILFKQLCG